MSASQTLARACGRRLCTRQVLRDACLVLIDMQNEYRFRGRSLRQAAESAIDVARPAPVGGEVMPHTGVPCRAQRAAPGKTLWIVERPSADRSSRRWPRCRTRAIISKKPFPEFVLRATDLHARPVRNRGAKDLVLAGFATHMLHQLRRARGRRPTTAIAPRWRRMHARRGILPDGRRRCRSGEHSCITSLWSSLSDRFCPRSHANHPSIDLSPSNVRGRKEPSWPPWLDALEARSAPFGPA